MLHVDECDSFGVSRKMPYVKIIATILLDDEDYPIMMDVPTRQFDSIVKIGESVASREGYSNACQVLFVASRNFVELPPPRVIVDNQHRRRRSTLLTTTTFGQNCRWPLHS